MKTLGLISAAVAVVLLLTLTVLVPERAMLTLAVLAVFAGIGFFVLALVRTGVWASRRLR